MLFTYDPSVHDYSEDKPELVDIGHNHFVYGNQKEIEEYKAIREKNEPLKSIQIQDPNEARPEEKPAEDERPLSGGDYILDRPIHDTGSKWYSVGSFFLPVIGLIAGLIFKKHKHIRNYKACKKGALIGFATFGAVILLFLIFLLMSVL